jgi:hypothetical protein
VKGWDGTYLNADSTQPVPSQVALLAPAFQCSIHLSVSDGTGDWEYADGSVRDKASFGFLSSRLALIVIVFADGPLAPAMA